MVLHQSNGFYSLLDNNYEEAFDTTKKPISLTDPSNIFQLDNILSDRLNQFQVRYARYMQCQDPRFASSVSDPPCDTNTTDSFSSVQAAYKSVLNAIQDVSGAFATQTYLDAKTPQQYNVDYTDLNKDYAKVIALRKHLDEKLLELQEERKGGPDTALARFESAVYINTLWVILATILIYFVFVGL
jgi:hypothetical protein